MPRSGVIATFCKEGRALTTSKTLFVILTALPLYQYPSVVSKILGSI